jgi:hypothetical protein
VSNHRPPESSTPLVASDRKSARKALFNPNGGSDDSPLGDGNEKKNDEATYWKTKAEDAEKKLDNLMAEFERLQSGLSDKSKTPNSGEVGSPKTLIRNISDAEKREQTGSKENDFQRLYDLALQAVESTDTPSGTPENDPLLLGVHELKERLKAAEESNESSSDIIARLESQLRKGEGSNKQTVDAIAESGSPLKETRSMRGLLQPLALSLCDGDEARARDLMQGPTDEAVVESLNDGILRILEELANENDLQTTYDMALDAVECRDALEVTPDDDPLLVGIHQLKERLKEMEEFNMETADTAGQLLEEIQEQRLQDGKEEQSLSPAKTNEMQKPLTPRSRKGSRAFVGSNSNSLRNAIRPICRTLRNDSDAEAGEMMRGLDDEQVVAKIQEEIGQNVAEKNTADARKEWAERELHNLEELLKTEREAARNKEDALRGRLLRLETEGRGGEGRMAKQALALTEELQRVKKELQDLVDAVQAAHEEVQAMTMTESKASSADQTIPTPLVCVDEMKQEMQGAMDRIAQLQEQVAANQAAMEAEREVRLVEEGVAKEQAAALQAALTQRQLEAVTEGQAREERAFELSKQLHDIASQLGVQWEGDSPSKQPRGSSHSDPLLAAIVSLQEQLQQQVESNAAKEESLAADAAEIEDLQRALQTEMIAQQAERDRQQEQWEALLVDAGADSMTNDNNDGGSSSSRMMTPEVISAAILAKQAEAADQSRQQQEDLQDKLAQAHAAAEEQISNLNAERAAMRAVITRSAVHLHHGAAVTFREGSGNLNWNAAKTEVLETKKQSGINSKISDGALKNEDMLPAWLREEPQLLWQNANPVPVPGKNKNAKNAKNTKNTKNAQNGESSPLVKSIEAVCEELARLWRKEIDSDRRLAAIGAMLSDEPLTRMENQQKWKNAKGESEGEGGSNTISPSSSQAPPSRRRMDAMISGDPLLKQVGELLLAQSQGEKALRETEQDLLRARASCSEQEIMKEKDWTEREAAWKQRQREWEDCLGGAMLTAAKGGVLSPEECHALSVTALPDAANVAVGSRQNENDSANGWEKRPGNVWECPLVVTVGKLGEGLKEAERQREGLERQLEGWQDVAAHMQPLRDCPWPGEDSTPPTESVASAQGDDSLASSAQLAALLRRDRAEEARRLCALAEAIDLPLLLPSAEAKGKATPAAISTVGEAQDRLQAQIATEHAALQKMREERKALALALGVEEDTAHTVGDPAEDPAAQDAVLEAVQHLRQESNENRAAVLVMGEKQSDSEATLKELLDTTAEMEQALQEKTKELSASQEALRGVKATAAEVVVENRAADVRQQQVAAALSAWRHPDHDPEMLGIDPGEEARAKLQENIMADLGALQEEAAEKTREIQTLQARLREMLEAVEEGSKRDSQLMARVESKNEEVAALQAALEQSQKGHRLISRALCGDTLKQLESELGPTDNEALATTAHNLEAIDSLRADYAALEAADTGRRDKLEALGEKTKALEVEHVAICDALRLDAEEMQTGDLLQAVQELRDRCSLAEDALAAKRVDSARLEGVTAGVRFLQLCLSRLEDAANGPLLAAPYKTPNLPASLEGKGEKEEENEMGLWQQRTNRLLEAIHAIRMEGTQHEKEEAALRLVLAHSLGNGSEMEVPETLLAELALLGQENKAAKKWNEDMAENADAEVKNLSSSNDALSQLQKLQDHLRETVADKLRAEAAMNDVLKDVEAWKRAKESDWRDTTGALEHEMARKTAALEGIADLLGCTPKEGEEDVSPATVMDAVHLLKHQRDREQAALEEIADMLGLELSPEESELPTKAVVAAVHEIKHQRDREQAALEEIADMLGLELSPEESELPTKAVTAAVHELKHRSDQEQAALERIAALVGVSLPENANAAELAEALQDALQGIQDLKEQASKEKEGLLALAEIVGADVEDLEDGDQLVAAVVAAAQERKMRQAELEAALVAIAGITGMEIPNDDDDVLAAEAVVESVRELKDNYDREHQALVKIADISGTDLAEGEPLPVDAIVENVSSMSDDVQTLEGHIHDVSADLQELRSKVYLDASMVTEPIETSEYEWIRATVGDLNAKLADPSTYHEAFSHNLKDPKEYVPYFIACWNSARELIKEKDDEIELLWNKINGPAEDVEVSDISSEEEQEDDDKFMTPLPK